MERNWIKHLSSTREQTIEGVCNIRKNELWLNDTNNRIEAISLLQNYL